eukprot:scaffold14698_cov135-Isochrysis_galbana.AAC.1
MCTDGRRTEASAVTPSCPTARATQGRRDEAHVGARCRRADRPSNKNNVGYGPQRARPVLPARARQLSHSL